MRHEHGELSNGRGDMAADWYPWEKMPIVSLVWMNWDEDDDGKMHHAWSSYVVYPYGDAEP